MPDYPATVALTMDTDYNIVWCSGRRSGKTHACMEAAKKAATAGERVVYVTPTRQMSNLARLTLRGYAVDFATESTTYTCTHSAVDLVVADEIMWTPHHYRMRFGDARVVAALSPRGGFNLLDFGPVWLRYHNGLRMLHPQPRKPAVPLHILETIIARS